MRFALAILVALAIGVTDAAAEGRWLRAESAHFVVYATDNESELRHDVEQLERFDAALRQLTQNRVAGAENKLTIYLLRDRSELAQVRPTVARTTAGFYHSSPEQIAAFAINRDVGLDARTILFHEYAHHFMFQYFAGAYPTWFVEGFAEYVSTAEIDARRTRLGGYQTGRTAPLFDQSWASMEDLLSPRREGARRVPGYLFYSQSWLNAHYILSSPERRRAFSQYLTALQSGADAVEAFEPAFGASLEEWQSQLRAYLRRGLVLYDLPPAAADLSIRVTRLPDSSDDLLLLMARARAAAPENERAELAEALIRAASRHPGDTDAQLALARAELLRNQPAAARPILEALVAAHPNALEAYYLLGMSHVQEADTAPPESRIDVLARARPHFVRAFQIEPNHAPTLFQYARTFPMPMEES